MKIQLKFIQALSVIGAGLMFTTGAYANELVNGDFELNPPTSGFGNHVGHPITPWVLGSGGNSTSLEPTKGLTLQDKVLLEMRQTPHQEPSEII